MESQHIASLWFRRCDNQPLKSLVVGVVEERVIAMYDAESVAGQVLFSDLGKKHVVLHLHLTPA
jgi:hypothetical protein